MSQNRMLKQFAIAVALVAVVGMSSVLAQPGGGGRGGRGAGGRGFGGGFGRSTVSQFVLRDDVKKELDLTDKQVDEVNTINGGLRERMSAAFGGRGGRGGAGGGGFDPNAMREQLAKVNAELREEVLDVLKSDQKDRLAELELQYAMTSQSADLVATLKNSGVDVSGDDEEKLSEALSAVNDQLQERMAVLRRELRKEALGQVVSESKLERLMGEVFAFSASAGQGGRGGGNARGGRGGGGNAPAAGNPRRRRPAADDADADEDADADDADTNPRRRRRRGN